MTEDSAGEMAEKPSVKEPTEQEPVVKEPTEQKPAVKEPTEQGAAVEKLLVKESNVKESADKTIST
jgi:hypothetical protein